MIEEKKRYFICNGLKVHWNFKLLPNGFEAITLFDHIFDVRPKDHLLDYLKEYEGQVMVNHERIHMLQAESFKTRYLAFYILYVWYWIVGLFKYGVKNSISYYNIPFEKEAFDNEDDFSYLKSHWRDYR